MFDRFAICLAYLAIDMDWNQGGMIPGRRKAISGQLDAIGFKPSPLFKGAESLSAEELSIYNAACERYCLGDGGYHPCACRDCFETAIGYGRPLCHECVDAGCDPSRECCKEPEDEDQG